MSSNFSINWEAVYASTSGAAVGTFLVTAEGGYVAATAANYAASPVVRSIALSLPINNIGIVQSTGDVPSSITGITNTAAGYARLNLTTGRAEWVASLGLTDIPLGRCVDAVLTLDTSPIASAVGPYVIASELDEDAADNSVALQAFFDSLEPGDNAILPVGTFYFTKTVFGLFENGFYNISLGSQGASIDSGTGGTRLVWNGQRERGSAGSLTCMFKGTADPTYTWTHFNYLRLSGGSGFTEALVDRQILLGNAARSYWNVIGVCVEVESATSMIVAIPNVSTDVSVPTNMDGNNGLITWEVFHPLLEIRSRDITFRGIELLTTGGATVKPSALICWSQSAEDTVFTRMSWESLLFGSADNVSKARAHYQTGRDFLPAPTSARYVVEGGYRRPFVPYQGDYLRAYNVVFLTGDRGHFTGNPTGQERDNQFICCDWGALEYGFDGRSRFTNFAEEVAMPGSYAADVSMFSIGGISGTFLIQGAPNTAWNFSDGYAEGTLERFAYLRCAGITQRPLNLIRCSFFPQGTFASAWIDWTNGPLSVRDSAILPLGTITGFKLNLFSNSDGFGVFDNVTLPSETDTGNAVIQIDGTSTRALVRIEKCSYYDQGTVQYYPSTDETLTIGYTTQGGKCLQNVRGLSKSWTAAKNLWGTVTITGAAVSQAVLFGAGFAEADANFKIIMTADSATGTPAAGSYTPKPATSKATTGFTANCEVAPGVGNSVTFTWMLLR